LKQIPADMVVNAMLVAMVSHANQPCDSIYHVGSSVGNPVRYSNLRDYNFRYFTAKPCLDKEGNAIKVGKVTVLENMNSFQRYMFIRYLLPLKVIHQFLILNYFSPFLFFFCSTSLVVILILSNQKVENFGFEFKPLYVLATTN
jgi:fatty acyl-CoA reductase